MRGYADAARAEWTKVRTLRSSSGLLAATIASGAGLSVAACAVAPGNPAKLALSGVQLAQALVVVWVVRAVTGEYRSGMIHTTLAAVPRRTTLVAAKATVIAVLALVAGALTVAASLLAARAAGAGVGFTRAAVGAILYLGLVGLLATGAALAVRDSAAATGTLLGLLYLFPLAAQLAGDPRWRRHIEQIGPSTAGLGVLAAWAAGALVLGGLALRPRSSRRPRVPRSARRRRARHQA